MNAVKTILFVENDPVALTMYQNRLQREGFYVETAGDGLVALQFLSKSSPDLVVLDLMLPRFSGAEVFRFMRKDARLRNVPVVIFSNAAMTDWPQDINVGSTQCLPKTESTFPQLLQTIRDLMLVSPVASVSPTAEPALSAPSRPSTGTTAEPSASPKSRAEFVNDTLADLPRLHELCLAYIKTPAVESSRQHLTTLHRRVHRLCADSAQVGCHRVAMLANAFGALLSEIVNKPSWATPSILQTMAQAMDCLRFLLKSDELIAEDATFKSRVLTVDDDPVCNHVMVTSLKRASFDASSLENPLAALELLRKNRFDLVLLDVNMPDLTGFELCVKLRQLRHCKTIPVIFVTAFNNFENRKQSVLSGGDDFITKPISPLELALKVTIHMLKAQVKRGAAPLPEIEPESAGAKIPLPPAAPAAAIQKAAPTLTPPITESQTSAPETFDPFLPAGSTESMPVSSPAETSPIVPIVPEDGPVPAGVQLFAAEPPASSPEPAIAFAASSEPSALVPTEAAPQETAPSPDAVQPGPLEFASAPNSPAVTPPSPDEEPFIVEAASMQPFEPFAPVESGPTSSLEMAPPMDWQFVPPESDPQTNPSPSSESLPIEPAPADEAVSPTAEANSEWSELDDDALLAKLLAETTGANTQVPEGEPPAAQSTIDPAQSSASDPASQSEILSPSPLPGMSYPDNLIPAGLLASATESGTTNPEIPEPAPAASPSIEPVPAEASAEAAELEAWIQSNLQEGQQESPSFAGEPMPAIEARQGLAGIGTHSAPPTESGFPNIEIPARPFQFDQTPSLESGIPSSVPSTAFSPAAQSVAQAPDTDSTTAMPAPELESWQPSLPQPAFETAASDQSSQPAASTAENVAPAAVSWPSTESGTAAMTDRDVLNDPVAVPFTAPPESAPGPTAATVAESETKSEPKSTGQPVGSDRPDTETSSATWPAMIEADAQSNAQDLAPTSSSVHINLPENSAVQFTGLSTLFLSAGLDSAPRVSAPMHSPAQGADSDGKTTIESASSRQAFDQIVLQVARIIFGDENLTEVKLRLVRIALERHTVQEILGGPL